MSLQRICITEMIKWKRFFPSLLAEKLNYSGKFDSHIIWQIENKKVVIISTL